jgi:glycosyltransferase involved in cell wall biosynthesis
MRRIAGVMSPEISAVLCTWNRADLLRGALDALLAQADAPPHEIIVVDNGSTDHTLDVVSGSSGHLRYIVESRQGLSFARNTGIAAARAPVVALTDDDVLVPPDWLATLARAFTRHPDASCIGGPVVPQWPATGMPGWLTARHWAPLGIQDYGRTELRVDATNPLCLIGANVAFRRVALDAIGGFDPTVQRVGEGAGSTEDHDCHVRLWQAGGFGIYDPAVRVSAVVAPGRVRKAHHRAWHFGHGRHLARMRLPEIERSRARLFGAPVHLVRQAIRDAGDCLTLVLRRHGAEAFEREIRLWFAAGFLRERWFA